MDQLLSLAALVLGSSGLSAVVVALLNRRWIKADRMDDKTGRQDDRIDADTIMGEVDELPVR